MRCRQCDYPLWNLTARECPECGAPFSVSEFEFVPQSVQFCCPHCAQAYYGTDDRGHLRPAEFRCVKCTHQVVLDQMIVRPLPGQEIGRWGQGDVPWMRGRGFGTRLMSLFRTMGLAMCIPVRIGRGLRTDGAVGPALLFAWLINIPVLICGFLLPYVAWFDPYFPLIDIDEVIDVTLWILGGSLAVVGLVLGWAMATHLLLRVSGPCERNLDTTIQAVAYSSGANLLSAIPCGGIVVGWIWWAISAVLMVVEAQRVSAIRAVLAVFIPPILVASLFVSGWVARQIAWDAGFAQFGVDPYAGWPGGATAYSSEISLISDGLLAFRSQDGQWPRHAAEMLLSGGAGGWDFVGGETNTYLDDIPIGDSDMSRIDSLASERRIRELVEDAAEALPEDVIAYRVGDFVLTYPGVMDDHPAEVWIVVMCEDPDSRRGLMLDSLTVAQRDGTVQTLLRSEWPQALADQNVLREEAGLAPLPDLLELTHGKPARPPSSPDVEDAGQEGE